MEPPRRECNIKIANKKQYGKRIVDHDEQREAKTKTTPVWAFLFSGFKGVHLVAHRPLRPRMAINVTQQ